LGACLTRVFKSCAQRLQVSTGGEIRTGTNPHATQIIKSQQATYKPHITAWIYLLLCAVLYENI